MLVIIKYILAFRTTYTVYRKTFSTLFQSLDEHWSQFLDKTHDPRNKYTCFSSQFILKFEDFYTIDNLNDRLIYYYTYRDGIIIL